MAECEEIVVFIDPDAGDDEMKNIIRKLKREYSEMNSQNEKDETNMDKSEICTEFKSNQGPVSKKSKMLNIEEQRQCEDDSLRKNDSEKKTLNESTKKQPGQVTRVLNSRLERLIAKKGKRSKISDNSTKKEEKETTNNKSPTEEKCGEINRNTTLESPNSENISDSCKNNVQNDRLFDKSKLVALDCEFVGVGKRMLSALGRCSIVDYTGQIVCDIYARPEEKITDYRTRWSGIRPRDLRKAVPFQNAKNYIKRILKGKVVVGHAVHQDFSVLGIDHPSEMIRDTSKYAPLKKMMGHPSHQPVSLKNLSLQLLGRRIQKREHCSVEDSRATMELYKLVEEQWEEEHFQTENQNQVKRPIKPKNKCPVKQGSNRQRNDSSNSQNGESFFDDNFWPNDVHIEWF